MTAELGYANCNECGGENTKVLLIKERGIWSKCKRCGFVERIGIKRPIPIMGMARRR